MVLRVVAIGVFALGAGVPVSPTDAPEPGSITGVVLDHRGEPLAGVRVGTLPNHDLGCGGCFAGAPPPMTRARCITDAKGRYRLDQLRPSQYQLRFERSGHATRYWLHHQVPARENVELPPMRYNRGTVVRGIVTLRGVPVPGALVSIGPRPFPGRRPFVLGDEATADERARSSCPFGFRAARFASAPPEPIPTRCDASRSSQGSMQLIQLRDGVVEVALELAPNG
ncbi:MAG: carboxypeptidase-like regulatory domain-containing protein [Planctomycetota bacterium]